MQTARHRTHVTHSHTYAVNVRQVNNIKPKSGCQSVDRETFPKIYAVTEHWTSKLGSIQIMLEIHLLINIMFIIVANLCHLVVGLYQTFLVTYLHGWVDERRYLFGRAFCHSQIQMLLSRVKSKICRASNSIFGMDGRFASEETVISLIQSIFYVIRIRNLSSDISIHKFT